MKYTQIRAFEKHLEGSYPQHFADIYFILSKDDFERKACLDLVVKYLLKDELQRDLAYQVYEADTVNPQILLNQVCSPVFFIKRQVVVIKSIDKLKAASLKELEKIFDIKLQGTCVIFEGTALNAATQFFKKGEKAGVIVEIPAVEKAWEKEKLLAAWLPALAQEEGKVLEPVACQLLLQHIGSEKALLFQEMQKLLCYVGERREITAQDVSAICLTVPHETAWQLGEAIFQKNAATALRVTKGLLEAGTSFIPLLKQLRTQIQTEFQVCSILRAGGTAEEVTKCYPYMRGPILARHLQMAQLYGFERFKEALITLDRIEVEAKNSGIDPEILAELLIVKLVGIA